MFHNISARSLIFYGNTIIKLLKQYVHKLFRSSFNIVRLIVFFVKSRYMLSYVFTAGKQKGNESRSVFGVYMCDGSS